MKKFLMETIKQKMIMFIFNLIFFFINQKFLRIFK